MCLGSSCEFDSPELQLLPHWLLVSACGCSVPIVSFKAGRAVRQARVDRASASVVVQAAHMQCVPAGHSRREVHKHDALSAAAAVPSAASSFQNPQAASIVLLCKQPRYCTVTMPCN